MEEKDWKKGRGIFKSKDDTVYIQVNGEDHLKIIVCHDGRQRAELDEDIAYQKLVSVTEKISQHVTFNKDDRLGFVASSPSNLGLAFHASIMIMMKGETPYGFLKK